GEGVNTAATRPATEIADEEVIVVTLRQSGGPVVEAETGRAGAEIGERRHDIGRLLRRPRRMPDLLGVEGSTIAQTAAVLIAGAPAAVAAGDDIGEAHLVAAVAVVVDGEEIAVLIEGEFLRIAQAGGDDFQIGAVEFTTKDSAAIGVEE